MENSKNDKKISIRLTDEATKKVNQAIKNGYNRSKFINDAIINCTVTNVNTLRTAMICICRMETELELCTDIEVQKSMRKELDELCRVLKSSQNPI